MDASKDPVVAARIEEARTRLEELRASQSRSPSDLAVSMTELAGELEDAEDRPPPPGSVLLEESLRIVCEVADDFGATAGPEMDDIVLEALTQCSRLLVMLGRLDETPPITAAIRARIGGDDKQLARAAAWYESASEHFDRRDEDPDAARYAAAALERLLVPYAEQSPPPADLVAVYVAAAFSMMINIALAAGQNDAAGAMAAQSLERFDHHPDVGVQSQMAYVREILRGLEDPV